MPTLLTIEQMHLVPTWEPETDARRRSDRPIFDMVTNVLSLFEDISRWDRHEDNELLFVHDTGVICQMRRNPPDDKFKPNEVSIFVVFWMEGMRPFRLRAEDYSVSRTSSSMPGASNNLAAKFVKNYMREETRETIEKIAVVAALCRSS